MSRLDSDWIYHGAPKPPPEPRIGLTYSRGLWTGRRQRRALPGLDNHQRPSTKARCGRRSDILRAMRSIGIPELVIMFGMLLLFILAPLALITFVWRAVKQQGNSIGSKSRGHCGGRIPDIGLFCPLCGQKLSVSP